MKSLIVLFIFMFSVSAMAQVPLFGPNRSAGVKCPQQSFSNTDTTLSTEPYFWTPRYQMFTGSASIAGSMDLTVGTDTLTTFYVRLIMAAGNNRTLANTALYDSSGWHQITAQTGDYIPAENAVGATPIDFSFDLSAQDFWKPCVGIVVQARIGAGVAITKLLELYVIATEESR